MAPVCLMCRYCNEGHWKECSRNRGDFRVAPNLVKVQFFMSGVDIAEITTWYAVLTHTFLPWLLGSAYAVSQRGAAKLLNSFPCQVSEYACSMAIDWHYSVLIAKGLINVYGMLPQSVVMPGAQNCARNFFVSKYLFFHTFPTSFPLVICFTLFKLQFICIILRSRGPSGVRHSNASKRKDGRMY
jgi:hypothetical protein